MSFNNSCAIRAFDFPQLQETVFHCHELSLHEYRGNPSFSIKFEITMLQQVI